MSADRLAAVGAGEEGAGAGIGLDLVGLKSRTLVSFARGEWAEGTYHEDADVELCDGGVRERGGGILG